MSVGDKQRSDNVNVNVNQCQREIKFQNWTLFHYKYCVIARFWPTLGSLRASLHFFVVFFFLETASFMKLILFPEAYFIFIA